ncbi:hypothetical protein [Moritella dasanensis]|uniref:hypothetical protein n=1 Tax=Moritella dasanensis TaxID=428031 RepID=UPI0003617A8D|nr:hypothetical protein [Moritella dasanensis]
MKMLKKSLLAFVISTSIVGCNGSSSSSGSSGGGAVATLPTSLKNCIIELANTLICNGAVEDLSELTLLPNLTSLQLDDVTITEAVWKTLPVTLPLITKLQLVNNDLPSNIDLLNFPNLTTLIIGDNPDTFTTAGSVLLNAINDQTQLQTLGFFGNGHLAPNEIELANFNALTDLDLSYGEHIFAGVRSGEGLLGQIEAMSQLTALNLEGTDLGEFDLSQLVNLTKLNFSNTEVFYRIPSGEGVVSQLENMPLLTELRIASTGILSIDLNKMTNTLTVLDLSNSSLFYDYETGDYDSSLADAFLAQLEAMTKLTELRLDQTLTPSTGMNGINLSKIANSLTILDLSGHASLFDGLTSGDGVLGQIENMDKLTELKLERVALTDIDLSKFATNLTVLALSGNPELFTETSILTSVLMQIERANALTQLALNNNELQRFNGGTLSKLLSLDIRDNSRITVDNLVLQNNAGLDVRVKGTGISESDEATLKGKYPDVKFDFIF